MHLRKGCWTRSVSWSLSTSPMRGRVLNPPGLGFHQVDESSLGAVGTYFHLGGYPLDSGTPNIWCPTKKAREDRLLTGPFGAPYGVRVSASRGKAPTRAPRVGGRRTPSIAPQPPIYGNDPVLAKWDDPNMLPAPESSGYPSVFIYGTLH